MRLGPGRPQPEGPGRLPVVVRPQASELLSTASRHRPCRGAGPRAGRGPRRDVASPAPGVRRAGADLRGR